MKIKLIFDDWRDRNNKSIYNTEKGVELSIGPFHSGTTFDGEIVLPQENVEELRIAIQEGYKPVFILNGK